MMNVDERNELTSRVKWRRRRKKWRKGDPNGEEDPNGRETETL
jgi:hypothetical protein